MVSKSSSSTKPLESLVGADQGAYAFTANNKVSEKHLKLWIKLMNSENTINKLISFL